MIQVEPSRCYGAPRISLADIRINLSGFRKFLTYLTIMRRFFGIYGILRMRTFCTQKHSEFALRQHLPFESSRSESKGFAPQKRPFFPPPRPPEWTAPAGALVHRRDLPRRLGVRPKQLLLPKRTK